MIKGEFEMQLSIVQSLIVSKNLGIHMWRSKEADMLVVEQFLTDLKRFQYLKSTKWEKIEEVVQMNNPPGSPSEDWIIPPDEQQVAEILVLDQEYRDLKERLLTYKPLVKECAKFLGISTHHKLDWLLFENPLIGNAALEDSLDICEAIKERCTESFYFIYNLKSSYYKVKKP